MQIDVLEKLASRLSLAACVAEGNSTLALELILVL
jgi:hypothetical protein